MTGVDDNGAPVTKSYLIPFGHRLKVMEGDVLVKGALLTLSLIHISVSVHGSEQPAV